MNPSTVELLLVEDNHAHAQLIRDLLQDSEGLAPGVSSFTIHHTTTLDSTLHFLGENTGVDCVLLDLLLPDSKGEETLTHVRARVPQTPVVVLTGLGFEVLGTRMIELGATDYLQKSTDLEARLLFHSVFLAVQKKRQRGKQTNPALYPTSITQTPLADIFSYSSDSMVVVDKARKIQAANDAYLKMTGLSSKEILERDFTFPLVPGSDGMVEIRNHLHEISKLQMRINEITWGDTDAFLARFYDRRKRHLLA